MNRAMRVTVCVGMLVVAAAAGVRHGLSGRALPHDRMAGAAKAFLASLREDQRAKCALRFVGPERMDWHYVPRDRAGIRFSDMDEPQKMAARALLRSALSSRGTLKVEAIMSLDTVLREMEKAAGGTGAGRDSLAYVIAVFGEPGGAVWGWKIEGHHVSLNFTCKDNKVAGVTPAFLGSNPGGLTSGERAGFRALAAEEDLGRELLGLLDESQRKEAVIATDTPKDILTSPGRTLDEATAVGLSYAKMSADQRNVLVELIEEFAGTLRKEVAEYEVARIRSGGMDNIRFAWIGGTGPGQGHYYRITGETFVIEYDNTQNQANHVHTVWHDRQKDFGMDVLKQHLRNEHAK